jgi:hypothetical protein
MQTWLRSIVCLVLASAASGAPGPEAPGAEGYTFFLDGRPFAPHATTITGEPGRLAAGDVIQVGGLRLTIGAEGEYRFRTAREGVRLERADGTAPWVAVRVGPHYGDGPDLVDGLAPLSEAEVRALWGLQAEVWNPTCVAKAGWLDLSRVFLEVGQTASERGEDLPELPAGLRYLEAGHFAGWKSLARLRDLEYLSVEPERGFDARRIAGSRRLRVLELGWRRLEHVEALGTLTALERLDLHYHDELTSIDFARSLSRLRHIDVGGTRVRDLTPLSELAHLQAIEASGSAVEVLPAGPLPALETLDLVASAVGDDAAAAFARAHPQVRVRHRWNASLREAVRGATRIQVVAQSSCSLEDASVVVASTDAAEIDALVRLLEVDEDSPLAVCGCLGGPEIEFHREGGPVESVALKCGDLLSWSGWPAQGRLPAERVSALVDWLARHGVTGPQEELRARQARAAAWNRKAERALQGLSPTLRELFDRQDQQTMLGTGIAPFRPVVARLAAEVQLEKDRLRVLFRILGAELGSWSGLEPREVAADRMLETYPRAVLERACAEALQGDDRAVRRGAARWCEPSERLPDWPRDESLREAVLSVLLDAQSPDVRDDAMALVRVWWDSMSLGGRERWLASGLSDPDAMVRRRAMLVAGEVRAESQEGLLIEVLAGRRLEAAPRPAVPTGEEETDDVSSPAVAPGATDAEVAALALGYLRSPRALAILQAQPIEASARLRVARALGEARCELLEAEDFRTSANDQQLQLAAVEAVVRCGGRHALDLALAYETASHGWEPDHVAGRLREMLLAADPPGKGVLSSVQTLEQLRGWYATYGARYVDRFQARD